MSATDSPKNNNSDDDTNTKKWNLHSPTMLTTLGSSSSSKSTSQTNIINPSNKRKSAFLPYRPPTTVLTNLQRGNTEATFFPKDISMGFHERAGQGELTEEQVREELERQKNNSSSSNKGGSIDFLDKYGFTALHWASFYGQLHTVKYLVDIGKADVNYQAPDMYTPLIFSAAGGHHEVVRFLIKRGASVNHMDIPSNNALMYAAAGNHSQTCHELLNSPDIDITLTNEFDDTAYSLAIDSGSKLAQAVIERYINALLSL